MMKRNTLFFLLFFICSSFLFVEKRILRTQDDNEIIWRSDRKLNWEDFKGVLDTALIKKRVIIVAESTVNTQMIFNKSKNGLPTVKVRTIFIKDKSWTVLRDEKTLKHEQLHFDIFELYTRKMRKAFDSLSLKKTNDAKYYKDIYDLYNQKCDKTNELYDNQVYFNDVRQEQWFKKIAVELEKLKKYEEI